MGMFWQNWFFQCGRTEEGKCNRSASLRLGVNLLLFGIMMVVVRPVWAQTEPTPTPDEAGVIYVVVQPNDTMYGIAARVGITLADLLALNGLQETDFIVPGQKLIVGYGEPPTTPTPDVTFTPTATLPPPTPRPPSPTPLFTAVCLLAFHDNNGNGLFDAGEPLQAAVAFTVYTNEAVITNYVTDGISEPFCIPLTSGSYQIARSVGVGETLTSAGSQAIILNEGDMMHLAFGGRVTGATAVPPTSAGEAAAEADDGRPYPGNEAPIVIGSTPAVTVTVAPTGGQPAPSISLIPLAAVIIGGLLLTIAFIFYVRNRA